MALALRAYLPGGSRRKSIFFSKEAVDTLPTSNMETINWRGNSNWTLVLYDEADHEGYYETDESGLGR